MRRGHYAVKPRLRNSLPIVHNRRPEPTIYYPTVSPTAGIPKKRDRADGIDLAKLEREEPMQLFAHEAYDAIDSFFAKLDEVDFKDAFKASFDILLKYDTLVGYLYRKQENLIVNLDNGILTEFEDSLCKDAVKRHKILNFATPQTDSKYNQSIDANEGPLMIVPFFDEENTLVFLFKVTREDPFTDQEVNLVDSFSNLFKENSYLIGEPSCDLPTQQETTQMMKTQLITLFRCRKCDFYSFDVLTEGIELYDDESGEFKEQKKNGGIIEKIIVSTEPCSIIDITLLPSYQPNIDGKQKDSILSVPIQIGSNYYSFVLYGKQPFTAIDEIRAQQLAPLILTSVAPSTTYTRSTNYAIRLKALLTVAESLSGVLDIDSLIPMIMNRACSLMNTERCSLFLIDTSTQELISRFHGGMDEPIRIPLTKGIAGHTATTDEIVNITDAYNDDRFDKEIDQKTGYKTKTILSVPIKNNRGEVVGVTEMINRKDGSAFDQEDIDMMNAFNVFCGISLDNAKLYQASINLTRQLRGIIEMSSVVTSSSNLNETLAEIAQNAKNVLNASRSTLYTINKETNKLEKVVNKGIDSVHGLTFAEMTLNGGKARHFSREEVLHILNTEDTEDSSNQAKPLPRAASFLKRGKSVQSIHSNSQVPTIEALLDFPLLTSDQRAIGVLELACSCRVVPEDVKLLDCFAVFAAVSIEKYEYNDIAQHGEVESLMKQWVTEEERKSFGVPAKLRIQENILVNSFDATQWEGMGAYKVIFYIFDHFGLLEEYQITSEKFFYFLNAISQTYNLVPYHNWRHAVDVTQNVAYQIELALKDSLSKFEKLSLLVAAICHDANHDGFTNVFNVKAETPLGILYKNQSVMEMHHCTQAISIISREECNLFSILSSQEYKQIWTNIIQLILATDMAKHHEMLKETQEIIDNKSFDLSKEEHRLIAMQMVLKCADISNVSRPFELADRWCDVLCEEFFRQGDLEKTSGMEYTSPLNDREHLDKAKSQIGFYTYVCLPLYRVADTLMPELKANTDQIASNLTVWKAASEKSQQSAQ